MMLSSDKYYFSKNLQNYYNNKNNKLKIKKERNQIIPANK